MAGQYPIIVASFRACLFANISTVSRNKTRSVMLWKIAASQQFSFNYVLIFTYANNKA